MTTTTTEPPPADYPTRTGTARRSTSAARNAAAVVRDVLIPVGGPGTWRDVALGVACEAEEAAARLLADLRRAGVQRRTRAAALAGRGALERARGRRRVAEALDSAVTAAATSPIVDRVVDAQLERILRPVVLAVLDEVLVILEKEPERVQSLIRGQRDSMVDELVNRIRTGAATGDTAVDRLTSRMFHRGRGPAPVADL